MKSPTLIDTDVCVVGAGIVGLAHAFEARRRGLEVVVLDRSARAVGASIRNFGHGFVAAMADGEGLECALLARERWIELGRRAGIDVLQCGSVIVARHEDELGVMAGTARDQRRGARVITPEEVAELAPIPVDRVVGALHAEKDIRVDPRQSVAGLASLLEQDPGARVIWNAHVQAAETGRVDAGSVAVRAALVIVCPGPDYPALPAELRPARAGLTRCRLQMLRVAGPGGRRYGPALLTGLSLLRYPAFTAQRGFERVRARIEDERPELVAAGIHLIVAQLPGGDLLLGDTHEYGGTVSPFRDERLDRLLLAEAALLLGVERLEVRERWQGVYPSAPGDPFMVAEPLTGVWVVEVVSGVGMTAAFGLAPRALDQMLPAATGAPREAPMQALDATPPRSGEGHVDCGP